MYLMQKNVYQTGIFVGVALLILLMISIVVQQTRNSTILGRETRVNLAVLTKEGEAAIVSYDPTDRQTTMLFFEDIRIASRTEGQYFISQLYRLGSYDKIGGEFAMRKLQGFLRVPLSGYIMVDKISPGGVRLSLFLKLVGMDETSLEWLDSLILFYRSDMYGVNQVAFDELVKDGAFVQKEDGYHVEFSRLQKFVGSRLFDWRIGEEAATVSIINESGIEGLATDVSLFIENLGMDVISVRAGQEQNREKTLIQVGKERKELKVTIQTLISVFGKNTEIVDVDTSENRSNIVIFVGRDTLEMF